MIDFLPGQVWVCNAVDATPPLLCVVGRLDNFEAEGVSFQVVSVQVSPHPKAKEAGWPLAHHMPFLETALRESEVRLVKEGVIPGQAFERGYALWREAYLSGNAGAFSIGLSEAYSSVVSFKGEQ